MSEGRFLHAGLTANHLEQVGRLIAGLHRHAEHWIPPGGFTRWRVADVSHAAAAHMAGIVDELLRPEDAAIVQGVIARVRETQRALDREPATFGLIHGDLHQENYLFHHGQVRAIDFDDCGWGYFLYDLAMPLVELYHHPRYPALREALLNGYLSVRPLPPEHERHLEVFDALKVLILTIWVLEERARPAFHNWQSEARRNRDWLGKWLAE